MKKLSDPCREVTRSTLGGPPVLGVARTGHLTWPEHDHGDRALDQVSRRTAPRSASSASSWRAAAWIASATWSGVNGPSFDSVPRTVTDTARMPSGSSVLSMLRTRLRRPAFWTPSDGRLVPRLVGGHAAGGRDPAAGAHERASRLERGQQRADTEGDVLEQLGRGQGQRVLLPEGARVEVQYVDPPERLPEPRHRGRGGLGVGDVRDRPLDGAARRHQLVAQLLELGRVASRAGRRRTRPRRTRGRPSR